MAIKFKALATRDGQKHAGTFFAESEGEARSKLAAQGYQVLSLEVAVNRMRYVWLGLAAIAVLTTLILSFSYFSTDQSDVSVKRSGKIVGAWVRLKSGNYLIAVSRTSLERAVRLRDAGRKIELKKMLDAKEVGQTNQFGGGLPVYVAEWNKESRLVQIKFRENASICWVEEKAVLK